MISSMIPVTLCFVGVFLIAGAHYEAKFDRYLRDVPVEEVVTNERQELEEPTCVDRSCTTQADCCQNAACIRHGTERSGICAKLYDRPEGKLCLASEDCAPGLYCAVLERYKPLGMCTNRNRVAQKKQYFDNCSKSSECDIAKGFCCREHARIGGVAKTICSYFEDPLEDCIF